MQATGRSLSELPARAGQLVTARTVAIFRYACPHCTAELTEQDDALFCTREGRRFSHEAGIWHLLRREREVELQGLVEAYARVRDADGWGAPMSEYCLALPFRDTSRRHRTLWRRHAAAFRSLERVLDREFRGRPVRALDLGAGNCWLTRRLTAKGYAACALDVRTDDMDGLGAGQIYREAIGCQFERVQAELECLPFVSHQFELVIANASLHYSEHLDLALDEARRVLAPDGIFVVMGSPFFHDGAAGAQMLADRQRDLRERLGIAPSLSERQAGYFTYGELPQRLRRHGLKAEVQQPFAGLRPWLRPWIARLRRQREPASYPLALCRPSE
jgi:ubiquinone/menaquinone biosynthesis C-methylase UbiE